MGCCAHACVHMCVSMRCLMHVQKQEVGEERSHCAHEWMSHEFVTLLGIT